MNEPAKYCENCGRDIGNVIHAIGTEIYCRSCYRAKIEGVKPERKSLISPFTGQEIPPEVIARIKQMWAEQFQQRLDEMYQRGLEAREKSEPPFDTGTLRHGWFTGYAPGSPSYIAPDLRVSLTIGELIRIQRDGYPEEPE